MHTSGTVSIPWNYDFPLPPPGTPVYMHHHVCPEDCNCVAAYIEKQQAKLNKPASVDRVYQPGEYGNPLPQVNVPVRVIDEESPYTGPWDPRIGRFDVSGK